MGPRNRNKWDRLVLLATMGAVPGRLRTEDGASRGGAQSFISDKDIVPPTSSTKQVHSWGSGAPEFDSGAAFALGDLIPSAAARCKVSQHLGMSATGRKRGS